MDKWSTPNGKERVFVRGDDEGSALPVADRLQSPLVITGPDGKIMTWDTPQKKFVPWSASSKSNKSRVKQQLLKNSECDASSGRKPNCRIPLQFITRQPGCLTPQSSGKNGLLPTPQHQYWTPGRPPKTPVGPEYAATPVTPPSKVRPPMSSCRKPRSKSGMRLRMLDDQELQASRVVQARQDLLMERQERAFTAWLNHVFDLHPTGGSQVPNVEDSVSRKYSETSLCSNSSLLSTDWQAIDEAKCPKDCVASPFRDPTYPSRSLRSPLAPLNGVGNGGFRSLRAGNVNSDKRASKDVFSTPDGKSCVELSPADLHTSPKKLRMITDHGYLYSRDAHMQDVCQISEIARRLKVHFGQAETGEILAVVTQLAKHIDERRLRMNKRCVILADVVLREMAIRALLNYNACWMRIGLHVVLGHTDLLGKRLREDDSNQTAVKDSQEVQITLLKVFIKRHFFAHPDQATKSATNKKTEGLYGNEHSETVGRVILKRFFLLVLVLDKLKCRTMLKMSDGIDGVDGGSPLLFRSDARLKSSRQVLQEFLSGVIHEEGEPIENLGAFGYHVHHHQVPLADYDFAVVNLIEDLRDGVRLCRLVQLLAGNDSRMLEHVQVPSNGRKRHLHNCQIALKGLARAGVPLEDEDGGSINAEDIIESKKDKVFSLLWNIMVHLQIPVLVSRAMLCQEIAKLQGTEGRVSLGLNVGTVELLLKWTQVTCLISGNFSVRNFKSSFGDGYAFFLIFKFYLPQSLSGNALLRPACPSYFEEQIGTTPDGKVTFSSTYKKVVAHNFGLVQDAARKLGSVPEVLQLEDLLVYPEISERNVVVFIAFLCSFLLKENAPVYEVLNTRKLGRILQDANANHQPNQLLTCGSQRKPESESLSSFNRFYSVPWPLHEAPCGTMSPEVCNSVTQVTENCERIHAMRCHPRTAQKMQIEWHRASAHLKRAHMSALSIQAHWRGRVVRRMLKSWTAAVAVIQLRYRALRNHRREQAAQILQCCFRAWAQKRKFRVTVSNMCKIQAFWWANEARGKFERERKAINTIETEWLHYVARRRLQRSVQSRWQLSESAQLIQAHWRGYFTRRFLKMCSAAASIIQSWVRGHFQRREYKRKKQRIQVHVQAMQNEIFRRMQHSRIARIQACWRGHVAKCQLKEVVRAAKTIQRAWRFFIAPRKRRLTDRAIKVESSIRIQARWRGLVARRRLYILNKAAKTIQRGWRFFIALRKRQLTDRAIKVESSIRIQARWRGLVSRRRLCLLKQAAKTIQRAWRFFIALWKKQLTDRAIKVESSIRIQARWRGLVARRRLYLLKQAATNIQREWRQLVARRKKPFAATPVQDASARQVRWSSRIRAHKQGHGGWQYLQIELQAAKTIQKEWRHFNSLRKLHPVDSAVQSIITEQSTRCIRIQAWWQKHAAWQQFETRNHAARTIQRTWRHWIASTRNKHVSALATQGRSRDHFDLAIFSTLETNALARQSYQTGHLRRHSFQRMLESLAIVIRTRQQAYLQRRIREVNATCALVVEACWRAQSCRSQFSTQRNSVKKILCQTGTCDDGVTLFQATPPEMVERRRLGEQRKTTSKDQLVFWARQAKTVSVQDQQALLYGLRSAVEFQTSSKKQFELTAADNSYVVLLKIESVCEVQQQLQEHEGVILFQAAEPESSTEVNFSLGQESLESGACLEGEEQADSANLHLFKKTVCSGDIFQSQSPGATYTVVMPTSPTMTIQTEIWKQYGNYLFEQLSPDDPSCATASTALARPISETFNSESCHRDCDSVCLPQFLEVAHDIRAGHHLSKHIGLKEEEPDTDRVDDLTRCLCGGNVLDQSSLTFKKSSPKKLNAANVIFSWFQTFAQRANYLRVRSCAVVIQRHIRGRINRSKFAHIKASGILIQAHWKGYLVRRSQSHPQNPWRELRQRIRTTGVGVQDNARLFNRLAEALSTLPHQETVSGILSTCRTLDVATQHSSKCCEQLAEAGAINTILLLIQTINRSPPLEQVLKHALSILSNLARYSTLATRVAQSPSAISIISEQLHTFRNDEGNFLQAMSVLQMVCKTPAGIEVLQRELSIIRRLLLIAQSLEGHNQAEKRTVGSLPWASPAAMQRKSAQTKMREAIHKFLSTVGLMNDAKGLSHCRTTTSTTPLRRQHTASTPAQSVSLVAPTCVDAERVGCPKLATRQALSPRNGR